MSLSNMQKSLCQIATI